MSSAAWAIFGRLAAVAIVFTLLLAAPAGGLLVPEAAKELPSVEAPSAASRTTKTISAHEAFAFLREAPLIEIEKITPEAVERDGPVKVATPDRLPGYQALSEDEKREAWFLFVLRTHADRQRPGLVEGNHLRDQGGSPGNGGSSDASGAMNLRTLWALEAHGWPQFIIPLSDTGATALITDSAVMKFASPGAKPTWMVKPGGWIEHAEATDVNGDGVDDIVLSQYSYGGFFYFLEEDQVVQPGASEEQTPSIAIIDGSNGTVIFRGFRGEQNVQEWTLSDVDGDGKKDILAQTSNGHLMAARLDGSVIWSKESPRATEVPDVSPPLTPFALYYYRSGSFRLADVDGDGVPDFVSLSWHMLYTFLPVIDLEAQFYFVTAVSGKDGSKLWSQHVATVRGYGGGFLIADGDLSADGKSDVLAILFSFNFVFLFPAPGYMIESGQSILGVSGADGQKLFEDKTSRSTLYMSPLPPVSLPASSIGYNYWSMEIVDADGDGKRDLVVMDFEETEEGVSVSVVGRRPSGGGDAPTEETYRIPVPLPDYGLVDGGTFIRDLDGDGQSELLLLIIGLYVDENDQPLNYETRVITFKGTEAVQRTTPTLLGLYDVDTRNKQAYGWTLENDRWVPLGEDLKPTAEGTRLVLDTWIELAKDVTNDGAADFLIDKTFGMMWVDGRTGKLLGDVSRPVDRSVRQIVEHKGQHVLIEMSYASGSYFAEELGSGRVLWSMDAKTRDGYSLRDVADYNNDGSLDALLRDYDYVPDSGTVVKYRVYDFKAKEDFWSRSFSGGWVTTGDYLPDRPGVEFLHRVDGGQELSLYVAGEDEARWTLKLEDEDQIRGFGNGFFGYTQTEKGMLVLKIASAATGKVEGSIEAGSSAARISGLQFADVNKDKAVDAVFYYRERNDDREWKYTLKAADWRVDRVFAEYALGDDQTGFSGVWIPGLVGDWDRDGLSDVLVESFTNGLEVRSLRGGAILARAGEGTHLAHLLDINKDGALEMLLRDDTNRLRLVAYDKDLGATKEEDFRLVLEPEESKVDPKAKEFFKEDSKIPAPGMLLGLLAIALALAAFRRRRF